MNASTTLKIDVWKGDWGLPSIDLDCLRFMTYIKFSGLEIELNGTNNPFWTPEGKLPVVHTAKGKITDFDDLTDYITNKRNCNPDHDLNSKQKAEVNAWTQLMQEKLYPALQYVWWVDQKNCNSVTRPWYSKAIPFPFSFYYPGKMAQKAKDKISSLYEYTDSEEEIEKKVMITAEKCLTLLSTRLGDEDFMFGSHPKSIDATIFAYLAPLLKAPFQNRVLQNHLKLCTNLHKFVTRINQRYYSTSYYDFENKIKEELKNNKDSDLDFPNKKRNQFFAILFASFAMIAYAFHAGIVEREPEGEYQEDVPYNNETVSND